MKVYRVYIPMNLVQSGPCSTRAADLSHCLHALGAHTADGGIALAA